MNDEKATRFLIMATVTPLSPALFPKGDKSCMEASITADSEGRRHRIVFPALIRAYGQEKTRDKHSNKGIMRKEDYTDDYCDD